MSDRRFSQADQEQEESFEDHRLSDLLPTDFINLVGLDPDQYLFPQNNSPVKRRMTEPVFGLNPSEPHYQRRYTTMFYNPFNPISQAPQRPIRMYKVALLDTCVVAFLSDDTQVEKTDGVMILDGQYIRFGVIVEELKVDFEDPTARRIIAVDKQSILSDYVLGQRQIATILVPKFLERCNIPSKLVSLEFVSFQARALLRVRLSNSSCKNIDDLIRLLIQTFQIAVEVYE
ncbi:hypothetical protein GPJ56_003977 [Histomonas meleagridis]|uniref:uncharacterized protein n=1 Tax=Histomonas meleagridis TaxID=135588 RepID=UPI0035594873|nr:hypothetical protein GPJ56_003977 [Histomonas meleagridis]KAH0798088.1 hypothetical protein GO595_009099 [Histomonas meleagridis]